MHMTEAETALQRKKLGDDPQRAAFFWEARKNGLVVRAEYDIHGVEHPLSELIGQEPYEFHAMPYRPTESQAVFVQIDPGFEPIWLFIVNHSIEIFTHGERIDSALIFGRKHPPDAVGHVREEVALILSDGTMAGFNKVETAKTVFFDAVLGAQYAAGLPELPVGG